MLSVVRHKTVIILACILVGLVLITCGGGLSEPPAATAPNIAATVEATVQAILLLPDQGRIAFSSYRDGNLEIYVMNTDGSDQTNLTNNDAADWDPSWSPDGSRIAFSSERDGNSEIYVMTADGSDQTRFTNNDRWEGTPSWSPIGVAYGQ